MLSIASEESKNGTTMKRFNIPKEYLPPTGYGEVKLIIQDGKIVDCKTTTSHKIISELKNKKE